MSLMVTRVGEEIFVTDTFCTQEIADLSLGILSGAVITCQLHEAKFDLRDGSFGGSEWNEPETIPKLRTFCLKTENDDVSVEI